MVYQLSYNDPLTTIQICSFWAPAKCKMNIYLICFGNSVGDPYGLDCGGTLIPGISIIQRKRVLRGRFINNIAGK